MMNEVQQRRLKFIRILLFIVVGEKNVFHPRAENMKTVAFQEQARSVRLFLRPGSNQIEFDRSHIVTVGSGHDLNQLMNLIDGLRKKIIVRRFITQITSNSSSSNG